MQNFLVSSFQYAYSRDSSNPLHFDIVYDLSVSGCASRRLPVVQSLFLDDFKKY